MDIQLISPDSILIKSKIFAIAVESTTKVIADVLFIMDPGVTTDTDKIENLRLVVRGPGEYEVGGVKMTAVTDGERLYYETRVEDMNVNVMESESIVKSSDKSKECDILILHAKGSVDDSHIAAMSPKVVVLYGPHSAEIAKTLGKDNVTPVAKHSLKKDKLPEEVEVVVLG